MKPRKNQKLERGGRPVPPPERAWQDKPVQTFYNALPLENFREALELAQDEKFTTLARLMLDPARRKQSFASKMIMAGITLVDLYDFWSKHQLHAGLLGMVNRVPKVLVDTAEDAEAKLSACNRCDGVGEVIDMVPDRKGEETPHPRICPVCEGSGKMRILGDRDCRELIFETMGITGKKSGAMVNIQQNFGLEADLGDVLQASQKVITAAKTKQEGEP